MLSLDKVYQFEVDWIDWLFGMCKSWVTGCQNYFNNWSGRMVRLELVKKWRIKKRIGSLMQTNLASADRNKIKEITEEQRYHWHLLFLSGRQEWDVERYAYVSIFWREDVRKKQNFPSSSIATWRVVSNHLMCHVICVCISCNIRHKLR